MPATQPNSDYLDHTGQNLLRVLIASYFLAISLGLVPGTDGTALASRLLADPVAEFVSHTVVFTLAYLVLMGIWLRPAALLLSLITFWSSYIANFGPDGPLLIGDFWRDLALVGALMLTYVQSGPRSHRRRAMLRWRPSVRRLTPAGTVAPRRVTLQTPGSARAHLKNVVTLQQPPAQPTDEADGERAARTPISENVFRDDFAAMAS